MSSELKKTVILVGCAALTIVVLAIGGGLAWYNGHKQGYEKAQAKCLQQQKAQAEANYQALRDEVARYQQRLNSAQQAEQEYLLTTQELTAQNAELQRMIDHVTQQYIDELGKAHPVSCVFTRGFVQQYNAAFGVPGATAAAITSRAGAATNATADAGAELRASGVSQRDILANVGDNGQRCQQLAAQVNGLLDYIEGVRHGVAD